MDQNPKTNSYAEAKILIVDDEVGNIHVLKRMLVAAGYKQIASTTNGRETAGLYQEFQPDLILLDLKMPNFSGFDVLNELKSIEDNSYLPVLILTAQRDHKTRLQALEAGAKDFVSKPFEMTEILARIRNMLEVRLLHTAVLNNNKTLEEKILARTQELHDTRMEVIRRLGRAAEYRDNETGMHVIRISYFCKLMAGELGMSEQECQLIFHASPMHDVGKIGIPDNILLKPGKLNSTEWGVMKSHAEIGARILSGGDSELMQMAEGIALSHHERWAGDGYPNGLRGEETPLASRIVAICDVFDALTTKRPYKDEWPVKEAIEEIEKGSGTHFDPQLVKIFLKVTPEMIIIANRFADSAAEEAETSLKAS